MKKIMTGLAVASLALTAMATTPALAQYAHRSPNGSQFGMHQSNAAMKSDRAYDAYAYAPDSDYGMSGIRQTMQRYPDSVVVNGHVVGADPDQAIRTQLRRDAANRSLY